MVVQVHCWTGWTGLGTTMVNLLDNEWNIIDGGLALIMLACCIACADFVRHAFEYA